MNPTRTSVVLMERRQASRVPVNRAARMQLAGTEVHCTVIDLSAGGAGIALEHKFDLPTNVLLLIEGENEPRECRIVWSDAQRLGVMFD